MLLQNSRLLNGNSVQRSLCTITCNTLFVLERYHYYCFFYFFHYKDFTFVSVFYYYRQDEHLQYSQLSYVRGSTLKYEWNTIVYRFPILGSE